MTILTLQHIDLGQLESQDKSLQALRGGNLVQRHIEPCACTVFGQVSLEEFSDIDRSVVYIVTCNQEVAWSAGAFFDSLQSQARNGEGEGEGIGMSDSRKVEESSSWCAQRQ